MHSSSSALLSLSLIGFLCVAAASHAEDTREACRGDAIKLCPDEVTNRDHDATRRCLRDHYRELSERCVAAIKARKEAEKAAQQAAEPDPKTG